MLCWWCGGVAVEQGQTRGPRTATGTHPHAHRSDKARMHAPPLAFRQDNLIRSVCGCLVRGVHQLPALQGHLLPHRRRQLPRHRATTIPRTRMGRLRPQGYAPSHQSIQEEGVAVALGGAWDMRPLRTSTTRHSSYPWPHVLSLLQPVWCAK